MNWIKKIVLNTSLVLFGFILSIIIIEIFLRIYNPFHFRVKANKITLPSGIEYIIRNKNIPKLDRIIVHTKNSIGFRGEEPPADIGNYLSIITIGGSTTECALLSDGKTWPDNLEKRLKKDFKMVWLNNAGFDGHSTFGHVVLMENYIAKLKPKVALFLVGINDFAFVIDNDLFLQNLRDRERFFKDDLRKTFLINAADYSEVVSLLLNFYRYSKAKKMRITHHGIDIGKMEKGDNIDKQMEASIKNNIKENFLGPFEGRIKKLIKISRENGIEPVFITQPILSGNVFDDVTNINLGAIKIGDRNGKLEWECLELFNDVIRLFGKQEGILVVDLAKKMPKSSRYYYDLNHYTNEGAEKVAEIIYEDLYPYLSKKYQIFRLQQ